METLEVKGTIVSTADGKPTVILDNGVAVDITETILRWNAWGKRVKISITEEVNGNKDSS